MPQEQKYSGRGGGRQELLAVVGRTLEVALVTSNGKRRNTAEETEGWSGAKAGKLLRVSYLQKKMWQRGPRGGRR